MLVITLGDPYSINIEMIGRELSARFAGKSLLPGTVTIVGSRWHWDEQRRRLGAVGHGFDALIGDYRITFLDVSRPADQQPAESLTSVQRGGIAFRALEKVSGILGDLKVLTCPIDKKAASEAGFTFGGQTEFFEELWDGKAIMILAGPRLRVGLATNHLALRDVSKNITQDLVVSKALLLARSLKAHFGIEHPRIAVAGINPHCGDGGLFGREDDTILVPAVRDIAAELLKEFGPGASVKGPLPADTVFYQAFNGAYDGVLAMYHDQGLGPLKTVHFDEAINLSGGLKHVRVSPDHGPARDHYLRGTGSSRSFAACFDLLR